MAWNSTFPPPDVFVEIKVRSTQEVMKVFRSSYLPKGKENLVFFDKDGKRYADFKVSDIFWRYA